MADSGWSGTSSVDRKQYRCGHCDHSVASSKGWLQADGGRIHLCPNCDQPTIGFADGRVWPEPSRFQIPGVRTLASRLPGLLDREGGEELAVLYEEVREAMKAGAYTAGSLLACALVSRIAVQAGADEGLDFMGHVLHLMKEGRTPPYGDDMVELMRHRFGVPPHRFGPILGEQSGFSIGILEDLIAPPDTLTDHPVSPPASDKPDL